MDDSTQLYPPFDPTLSRRFQWILSLIGTICILIAVAIPLIFYGPVLRVELMYRVRKLFHQTTAITSDPFNAVLKVVPDSDFALYIPKIDAKAKVIANVSTINKDEYSEVLKKGIAHAAGTMLPGNKGNIFLFAHSTDSPINIIRFNAVFYLLSELEKGDEAFIVYKDKVYRYVVYDKKIVAPTDGGEYLKAENENNDEVLILQTCYPPATLDQRLLIFARRVEGEQAFLPHKESLFETPNTPEVYQNTDEN